MPSLYEPFGLVYVESALCGTPVIFGESAGAAEVLPPEWGLCLHNRSPEVLAEMIRSRCESSASFKLVAVPAPTMAEHVEALKHVLTEARQDNFT
jgi:glycogen synthase